MERPIALVAAATALVATPSAPSPPIGAPASAQLVVAPPTPPPVPLSDEALVTLGEAQDRMTVPVSIDARGPWNFIVDTGAERTVVSRELAGVLGLAEGPAVRVIAMTGAARVGSVIVPALRVSTVVRMVVQAPALGARDLGAAGMLGLDALQGHVVAIDFTRGRMLLKPARPRAGGRYTALPGEVIVTAKSLYGQLIVTDASWHGRRIAVIVDTGSPVTVGNGALLAAITRRRRSLGVLAMTSATGGTLHAEAFSVDRIDIGGAGFRDVRVAFSDVPPFARFGLGDTPALLLGMDMLRLFRAVDIDFANRQIRFAFPRGIGDASISGVRGTAG